RKLYPGAMLDVLADNPVQTLFLVVAVGTVLLGLSGAFQRGAFAGVGTSTPTLAAATAAAGGGTEPAVGPPGRGHRGRAGRRGPFWRGGPPGPPRRPRPAGPRRPARPAGRPAPGGRPPGPDGRAQPLPGRHRAPGQ